MCILQLYVIKCNLSVSESWYTLGLSRARKIGCHATLIELSISAVTGKIFILLSTYELLFLLCLMSAWWCSTYTTAKLKHLNKVLSNLSYVIWWKGINGVWPLRYAGSVSNGGAGPNLTLTVFHQMRKKTYNFQQCFDRVFNEPSLKNGWWSPEIKCTFRNDWPGNNFSRLETNICQCLC